MKRLVFVLMVLSLCINASAQLFTPEQIEAHAEMGTLTKTAKVKEIAKEHSLNENGEFVLSVIKEYSGQSKSDLYKKIYNWIIPILSNAESAIQIADEDKGLIIVYLGIPAMAKRTMGDNSYVVSIRPLLKFDFKDGRVRFTYRFQHFNVQKTNDDSGYGFGIGGGFFLTGRGVTQKNQVWPLSECYPYTMKGIHPQYTATRGLINSVACYNILVEQINEVLSKPLVIEDDNW